MNIRKSLVLMPLLVIVSVTMGASVAFADVYSYNGNNYSIPSGYQSYQGGIFYNPNTGIYLNPVTGQTSNSPLPNVATGAYSVPQGFNPYNADTYFNPSSGTYFNRVTGQISQYSPTNPATYNPDGTIKVLPGYSYYGNGLYYNPNTSTYWNQSTGQYTSSVPNYVPIYNPAPIIGQPTPTYAAATPTIAVTQIMIGSPALPRTGAGGTAPLTITILLASLAVVVGGVGFAVKKVRA